MESVTFTVTQDEGFHRLCQGCEELPFTRGDIYQFNILEDGTAVVLRRIRGDLDCARQLIDEEPNTLAYSVSGGAEGEGLAYVHAQPPESIAEVVKLPRTHGVILEFPLEGVSDTEIRVTMVSETREILQEALADIPDSVDVTIERLGGYPSNGHDLSGLLTDRQQEILAAATELGYYDVPREATHADIAEATGLSPSTVSEHMQKIEARTFEAVGG